MLSFAGRLSVAALFAVASFGQTSAPPAWDKVFYLTHVADQNALRELFNAVRALGEIPSSNAALDETKRTISVRGTVQQVALTEWLCGEMDKAASPAAASPVKRDYQVKDDHDPAVQVYYLAHTAGPQQVQEMVNVGRSITSIQRFFPSYALNAVVMRATPNDIALADWLLSELDTAEQSRPNPVMHDHSGSSNPRVGTAAQVFFLAHTETPLAMQEIVNLTRSLADIQRVFPVNHPRALALLGSPDQVAFADWLLTQLDKPADATVNPAPLDFKVGGDPRMGNIARLTYLTHNYAGETVSNWVKDIRLATGISRMFYNTSQNAVAMRGTGDQVARAEQLLRSHDTP
jgi:hypothetical protein